MPDPLFPRIAVPCDDGALRDALASIPEEWWAEHMIHATYPSGRAKIEVCWDDQGTPFLVDACGHVAYLPDEWIRAAPDTQEDDHA